MPKVTLSLLSILMVSLASSAFAGPITYSVLVDSSSIEGSAGSLDLNFNPGPLMTQSASVQILNFGGNGSLVGLPLTTGDVGGVLPGTLTFDNGSGFNDFFQSFTFGSSLLFSVSLYGPALTSPSGTSTSGSTFAFSMFSDPAGTVPALTTNTTEGFAFTIDVDLDGSTSVTDWSAQTVVVQASEAIPEPNTFYFIALAVGLWLFSGTPKLGASPTRLITIQPSLDARPETITGPKSC